MVMIKRQSYPFFGGSRNDELPTNYHCGSPCSTYSFSKGSLKHREVVSVLPRWMISIAYGVAALSWIGAYGYHNRLSDFTSHLEMERLELQMQKDEALRTLGDAKESLMTYESQVKKLQRTARLFDHEKRMKEELIELHSANNPAATEILRSRTSGIVMSWIDQRHEALKLKIQHLQRYVQQTCRMNVISKYGPGPHYVRFKVKIPHIQQAREFTVQMASLDLVPHSVQTFLDMISQGMFDNTVFYHHDQNSHVIAAAPVVYGTFEQKSHHFEAMGFNGVSFAEYSNDFPHEEYSLGFSGRGPNFYINTMDNTRNHGPGGQGHHELPDEADPCFGRIISGQSVIKEMMSLLQKGSKPTTPISWHDYDLTHIIKVELL